MGRKIIIDTDEEKRLKQELENRQDFEAQRMRRYLAMPDLSRTPGSPVFELAEKVKQMPAVQGFDEIIIPEIVPVSISFDLFNFAADHPARTKSDTYYVDDKNILRTHDTVMWYYYFQDPEIQQKLKARESVGVICYGKVYRKDEIDRRHLNIFHQIGGLYMVPDEKKQLTIDDLKEALTEIAQTAFGKDIKYRFNEDTFPYTNPSLEMEVEIQGKWVEVLGGGMPKKEVMANFGVEGYNGWAFGFGLERLAIIGMELPDIRLLWSEDERVQKQLHLGKKYVEVSKFPPITRDISFIVSKDFVPNDYFEVIRDIGGDLVEEVTLLDKYENDAKFGPNRMSYTYRVIYRSIERTLKTEEIEPIQEKIVEETKKQYNAELR